MVESPYTGGQATRACQSSESDPWNLAHLLRFGGVRRGEHTGQRGQQEAAAVHHSMT
jgi:hypothetical protein